MQEKSIIAGQASSYGGQGFTLLEVLIAMFILVVALLSLVSVAATVIKGNTSSKEMTTATTLAKDKLEATMNLSYANVVAGTESFDATGQAAGAFFTRALVVLNDTPAANMKTVTVTVSWNSGALARSVIVNTIIAR